MSKTLKYNDYSLTYDEYLLGYENINGTIEVEHNYSKDYLTLDILEDDSKVILFINDSVNFEYSTDGKTWIEITDVSSVPSFNSGQSVKLRGLNITSVAVGLDEGKDWLNKRFNASGNIMSIIYGSDFQDKIDLTGKSLIGFFAGSSIIDASNLILPATILSNNCYESMFQNCALLETAPALPAINLTDSCYNSMFVGCEFLTLPPELPSTQLTVTCYAGMFHGCTSLTTAPELPATTLIQDCYAGMFNGCTSLNYIKALFTTTPSIAYTNDWVLNVAATGTFVKSTSASWDVTGSSGIPEGWTVIETNE